jgi:transaldolase/glucose-6-phosphate isomerase
VTIGLDLSAGALSDAVDARLAAWDTADFAGRLWQKDPSLWSADRPPELADRLGWLDLPENIAQILPALDRFAMEMANEGVQQVVVLGMGGSSLAPEVFQKILGNDPRHPRVVVLDSTHPAAVAAVDEALEPATTLFVVSSKSGTTLETTSLFSYFWDRFASGITDPGRRFVAVTDPGSTLESTARAHDFRAVFTAPPDVGGRYSALSVFGLVPAAAMGADLAGLAQAAREAAAACGAGGPAAENPGLALGALLGEAALAGRDKATFLTPLSLRPLVAWIEQLVAESTGKDGRGIVPVGGDERAAELSEDRVSVIIDTEGEPLTDECDRLRGAGKPFARLRLPSSESLAGAMFTLEVAVAAAGAVLGIHPFDQPDVQLAKDLARDAMAGRLDLSEVEAADAFDPDLSDKIDHWLGDIHTPGYISLQAYLPPAAATRAALEAARRSLRDGLGVVATADFGPRFLHSTGQLHKGGPPGGCFLQIVDTPRPRLAVPGTDFTFDELIAAQAAGDFLALRERGHHVLRISLGSAGPAGLEAVVAAVAAAARR